MQRYQKMLQANRAWVEGKLRLRPDFFTQTAKGQQPELLWIGCSDSRVPAEEITGAEPGELFVHRNIANQVIAGDASLLSVLQYAVDVLKVRRIIVCGHTHCGGVAYAMTDGGWSTVDRWLDRLRSLRRQNEQELKKISEEEERFDRLVELNLRAQLRNLAQTETVRDAWARGALLPLHGWIYDLRTGLLEEVETLDAKSAQLC